jgi:hypothetical protein
VLLALQVRKEIKVFKVYLGQRGLREFRVLQDLLAYKVKLAQLAHKVCKGIRDPRVKLD